MTREQYTPIPEVNSDRLRFQVTYPFGLEENIGVRVSRVETLCQIAGFNKLIFQSEDKDTTSSVQSAIVGMTASGTAMAGKTRVKMIPPFTYKQDEDSHGEPQQDMMKKHSIWPDLEVKINVSEIKQRLNLLKKPVKDVVVWSAHTNSALKKSIVRAGVYHLIADMDIHDIAYAGILNGVISTGVKFFSDPLYCFFIFSSVFTIKEFVEYGIETRGSGRRISLFLGPEVDRALALATLTLVQPLAAPVNK